MGNLTQIAIKDAFMKLLNEHPISQITVKDIVSECDINRNTFYYHFSDIPSLVESIITEEADKVIAEFGNIQSLAQCLELAIQFALDNKRAVYHLYNSSSRDLYEQYLWKVCDYAVNTFLDTAYEGPELSEDERQSLVNFYKCELFGQVMFWAGKPITEDAIDQLHNLFEMRKKTIKLLVSLYDK